MEVGKMYKYRFFLDFDKEEKWLEQLAREGFHLKKVSFGYLFQRGEPINATIKIDFRKFGKKEDFINYRTLFEDSGWKHLAGTKNSGMQYFQKVNEPAGNDIFSDTDSKASRYKRLSQMFFTLS